MKIIQIAGLVSLLIFGTMTTTLAAKGIRVKGYYKSNTETYVEPSYRTTPNNYKLDNYSTKGNYNPYSGKVGTKKAW